MRQSICPASQSYCGPRLLDPTVLGLSMCWDTSQVQATRSGAYWYLLVPSGACWYLLGPGDTYIIL